MKVDDKSPKRPLIFYYLIAMVVLMLLNALVFPAMLATPVTEVGYNDFLTMIDNKQVKEVAMEEDQILFTATDANGQTAIYKTGRWPDEGLTERLYASGAEFASAIPTQDSPLLSFLTTWVFPILLFVAIGQIMGRMLTKRMGGNAMQFGKSNAKIYVESQTGKTFADVAGQDEAKDALREIVDFLHNPDKYKSIGASLPKGAVISEKEKKIIAYHEIGHALVTARQKNAAPVHKITIIPRTSGALGYTMQIEEGERVLMSREDMLSQLATLTGGRAAEEVVFGSITSGASNDIEKATQIARAMITRYGMSDQFGMVALETVNNPYLSSDSSLVCSPETSARVDAEVQSLIAAAHDKAVGILKRDRDVMDKLAAYLLEKETITGAEFMDILEKDDAEKQQ